MSKKDVAWKWVKDLPDSTNPKYFLCGFCDHKCTGGIARFKQHLACTHYGISSCPKVPQNVKEECIAILEKLKRVKQSKTDMFREIGGSESVGDVDYSVESGSGSANVPKPRGAIDKFVNVEARQSTLNNRYKKEERKEVCKKIGLWFYTSAIPFNAANTPYYQAAMEEIAKYGVGFKPPSSHELRTWILKESVEDVENTIGAYIKDWQTYGCTIMSDGWTDGKSRVIINFLINSPKGTWFLKSIDASDSIKNADLLVTYFNSVIDEIGEENVTQIVTDNASNYKRAGNLLMEERKKLWWTPCAAHCIDLMLEDISKLSVFSQTIQKAKFVVKFIYGHSWVLALMRKFTKNRELIRPAITRFATSYLTLQSLYMQKEGIISLFSSKEWSEGPFAKKIDGVQARKNVLFDGYFWQHIAYCVKSVLPLVCVLREVDGEDRPAMGYIYELMDAAKEKIAINLGNNERKYKPIWSRIDRRWESQLHQPLHAAGYYLNPQFRYDDTFSNVDEVKRGLYTCMDRMLGDSDERLKADCQLDLYDRQIGLFGSNMAIKSRKMRSPVYWWERFGVDTPDLTKFAIRVLSLTCSASGCERNWSTFQWMHSKKRNRLEHKRLHSLVYVKYNTALRQREIMRRKKMDPIVVNEIESDDEWIAELENPVLPSDPSWLEEDDQFLDVDAIRNMPASVYEETLRTREPMVPNREPTPPRDPTPPPLPLPLPPPPRVPTPPPRVPTPLPIISYKRRRHDGGTSNDPKGKGLRIEEDDIGENNPFPELHTQDLFHASDDDSLDGDLLMDEEEDII